MVAIVLKCEKSDATTSIEIARRFETTPGPSKSSLF